MKTDPQKQSSPNKKTNWLVVSAIAFLLSISAAGILIFYGKRLDDIGIVGNIYYMILIPLGLSSAAFLSGAMRSYATFKSAPSFPYGKLHLAGPVVVFAVVVGGGFVMPNLKKQATSFDLKIRVVSDDSTPKDFNGYKLQLNLGKYTFRNEIHNGEVEFHNIPIAFHNAAAKVVPLIKDYEPAQSSDIQISKDQDNIYFKVTRTEKSLHTELRGTITDENNAPVGYATLDFGSGLATTKTNDLGNFACSIPLADGEKVPLKILVGGKVRYHNDVTLSAAIPYDLKINTKP